MNRFFKNGALQDEKITDALRKAADDYENGEIIEVKDVLVEIFCAITDFEATEKYFEAPQKNNKGAKNE